MSKLQLCPKKKRKVWNRDRYMCKYCGCKLTDNTATVDHILSRGNGGGNDMSNLATSCRQCNNLKSQRETIRIY